MACVWRGQHWCLPLKNGKSLSEVEGVGSISLGDGKGHPPAYLALIFKLEK